MLGFFRRRPSRAVLQVKVDQLLQMNSALMQQHAQEVQARQAAELKLREIEKDLNSLETTHRASAARVVALERTSQWAMNSISHLAKAWERAILWRRIDRNGSKEMDDQLELNGAVAAQLRDLQHMARDCRSGDVDLVQEPDLIHKGFGYYNAIPVDVEDPVLSALSVFSDVEGLGHLLPLILLRRESARHISLEAFDYAAAHGVDLKKIYWEYLEHLEAQGRPADETSD
jgi:hypothetical protein